MLPLKPLDETVPIFSQLNADVSPVVLVNVFTVGESDIPALLKAWADDATWKNNSRGISPLSYSAGLREAPSS